MNSATQSSGIRNHVGSRTDLFAWTTVIGTGAFALALAGVPLISAVKMAAAVGLYSLPWFGLLQITGFWSRNVFARIVIALGSGTAFLAVVFAFSPIADHEPVFWIAGLGICALVFISRRVQGDSQRWTGRSETTSLLPLGVMAVLVAVSAYALRFTHPIHTTPQLWMPDDYPLFAEWGRLLVGASGANGVIEGFSLRYHWLAYALSGGLDTLFTSDFIIGPSVVLQVWSWIGIGLGAIALVKVMAKSRAASVIAVGAVLFSSNLGLLAFSMGGLGVLTISPSHLVSSFWLVSAFLLGYPLLTSRSSRGPRWILFFLMGFILVLAKVTAFASLLLALLVVAYLRRCPSGQLPRWRRLFVSAALLGPLLVGGVSAYTLFIHGNTTEIKAEELLLWTANTGVSGYLIQVLPVLAYAFSILVWILPVVVYLFWGAKRTDPLVVAASVLAISGFVIALVFELRDANETWFLQGSLVLILPVSAYAAWEYLKPHFVAQGRRKPVIPAVLVATYVIPAAAFLTVGREAPILYVRPWLVPLTLVVWALLFAACMVRWSSRQDGCREEPATSWRAVISTMTSLLFLLTITYGVGLKYTGAERTAARDDQITVQLDEWIHQASLTAQTIRSDNDEGSLAVYSTVLGEQTLARWIPYLAQMPAYFIRDDDEVHLIYRSESTESMLDREMRVRNYVENQDPAACAALRDDGVTHVWLTPNKDFASASANESFDHSVISLDC